MLNLPVYTRMEATFEIVEGRSSDTWSVFIIKAPIRPGMSWVDPYLTDDICRICYFASKWNRWRLSPVMSHTLARSIFDEFKRRGGTGLTMPPFRVRIMQYSRDVMRHRLRKHRFNMAEKRALRALESNPNFGMF